MNPSIWSKARFSRTSTTTCSICASASDTGQSVVDDCVGAHRERGHAHDWRRHGAETKALRWKLVQTAQVLHNRDPCCQQPAVRRSFAALSGVDVQRVDADKSRA